MLMYCVGLRVQEREIVDVSEESEPEPAKKRTANVALELGKSMSITEAEEEEATRQIHATHARIVTESVPKATKKKTGSKSTRSVVIQDTPSDPKSKLAASKLKLKGIPSLTPEEQLAADTMQVLKESKKPNIRQPGTGDLSEGTSIIPGVIHLGLYVMGYKHTLKVVPYPDTTQTGSYQLVLSLRVELKTSRLPNGCSKLALQRLLFRSNPKTLDEAFSSALAAEARFTDLQLLEFLSSYHLTLGEAFFRARITEARFEDENNQAVDANVDEEVKNVEDQQLPEADDDTNINDFGCLLPHHKGADLTVEEVVLENIKSDLEEDEDEQGYCSSLSTIHQHCSSRIFSPFELLFMASGGSDQNAEYALSKLLKIALTSIRAAVTPNSIKKTFDPNNLLSIP
ncbi:hypothetical protein Tco_0449815 [Tanacetum coccineum]